jgi:hypothetical protein
VVDRESRDALAEALRSFMDDEAAGFALDEAEDAIWKRTEDETVRSVAEDLELSYGDPLDHWYGVPEGEWKHLNRLLLLLESEGELEIGHSPREWHWTQLLAGMLLAGFGVVVWQFGGIGFFRCAAFFGPPSMLLRWLNSRRCQEESRIASPALAPFGSFGGLRRIRRSVPGFVRRRCVCAVRERGIWSRVFEVFMYLYCAWLWCVLSPLVLFVQMLPLPDGDLQTRVWLGEATDLADQSCSTWSPEVGSEG